ncbi:PAS domain S-box protein [Actinomadura sp. HBU206391]|uniref:PAS domain-containing sensor histidine kinase n=1 Tax=Actinomadura sp. HBU206391 TaxID=2731692 RepID=UPI00164F9AB6|nr:PAS domain S-box protein [Actinomadura sp. HBU206391]MBC6463065.1 PAS domain S-box protein [Actinomadura sp. HBU206391]
MRSEPDRRLAEALEALAERENELETYRQKVGDLNSELEQTNRGLIALLAELEEARQAESDLAAIVQSSDDAMFSMSSDGLIQTWNLGAERLFGHSTAEVVGRPVGMLMLTEARDDFEEAVTRTRSGGRAETYDTRFSRSDGSPVDVAVTLSAMRDPGGALTGFAVVLRNVTDRLRIQAELAAARADQEVMIDRDRIARDLHDMVIQRVFGAGLALQAVASLITHPSVSARLQAVIGELDVTIRELRTAIYDLHSRPQQATTLRDQLLDLTSMAAEGLGFTPTVSFHGPVDTAVPDEVIIHLLAVVREALSNIARHSGASAAELTLSAGTELVLNVTDNGHGLGTVTRTSGLRNLRDRAQALGGAFEATGRPGNGTSLEWRVPLS